MSKKLVGARMCVSQEAIKWCAELWYMCNDTIALPGDKGLFFAHLVWSANELASELDPDCELLMKVGEINNMSTTTTLSQYVAQ